MEQQSEEVFDYKFLTHEEFGSLIKAFRELNQWTQATLAELSGLSERTIQRAEKGEASNPDTRRAIARGFGIENLDAFNRPFPILNEGRYKAYLEEIESSTIVLDVTRIEQGRTARLMVEGSHSSAQDYIGEPTPDARQAFAELIDNLRDYNDIREVFSETHKLEFDAEQDRILEEIGAAGGAVGIAKRRAMMTFANDAKGTPPMNWTNVFLMLSPKEDLPTKIRVPKMAELGS